MPATGASFLLCSCTLAGAVRIGALHGQGEAITVKNADVRGFLEKQTLKGPIVNHPNYAEFPVKGVYMYKDLGPAAVEDFSFAYDWDQKNNSFWLSMEHAMMQSGIPDKHAGMGPYLPGTWMGSLFNFVDYKVFFRCPPNPILDGQHCEVDGQMLGMILGDTDESNYQYFIKHDGGRSYERRSNTAGAFEHTYWLHRLVDETGKIDEENYKMLMEKLGGQDLISGR